MMIILLRHSQGDQVMVNKNLFIDTSAFYALMDLSDKKHQKASGLWVIFLDENRYLKTSNYIVIETLALLQSRLGFDAANLWQKDILDIVDVLWIDQNMHKIAFDLWLSLGRRKLSFVDCTSFVTMRHNHIEDVFCFDRHFAEQNFNILEGKP